MSELFVEIVEVADVLPHPNADRLEVAKVHGTTVITGKGNQHRGARAVYFPPGMLLPSWVSELHEVTKYLKHGIYPGEVEPRPCRVAACRLRSQPSYGYLAPVPPELVNWPVGSNVSVFFGAHQYVAPVKVRAEDQEAEHPKFHEYTNIKHYWRYPDAIPLGTLVRITEKIHGTNSRVAVINTGSSEFPNFEYTAGSHHTRLKNPTEHGRTGKYWAPLSQEPVMALLNDLCDEKNDVIIFAEIFGPGVQDMDYGGAGYRVFDISVNGHYKDWSVIEAACREHGVETVPLLYSGPYEPSLVEQFTHGPTTVMDAASIKSSFKGREGIVITPLVEQWSERLLGRMILKSVSADYLDRKGAEDNA